MRLPSPLRFEGVSFSYPGNEVFTGLELAVRSGEILAVLGPNGVGKTSLVKLATRVLAPTAGRIFLLGDDLASLSGREAARRVAVVPQEEPTLYSFSVEEAVLMGRTPWLSGFGFEGEEDRLVARESLAAVNASSLVSRDVLELSGGERQRVLLARALAQRAGLLLLDEPTAHLDIRYQMDLLRLLVRLRDSAGLTVVFISHDVNLASRMADRLVLLSGGGVAAEGTPEEVLTPEIVAGVYGTAVAVRRVEGLAVPQVFPE